MNTFVVTTTDLKRDTAHIVNRIIYEKKTALVKRYGKTVIEMWPRNRETPEVERDINQILMKSYGAVIDFPDVTKLRRSRKHIATL